MTHIGCKIFDGSRDPIGRSVGRSPVDVIPLFTMGFSCILSVMMAGFLNLQQHQAFSLRNFAQAGIYLGISV